MIGRRHHEADAAVVQRALRQRRADFRQGLKLFLGGGIQVQSATDEGRDAASGGVGRGFAVQASLHGGQGRVRDGGNAGSGQQRRAERERADQGQSARQEQR